MSRGGGVYLETGHFKRVVWPSNEFWRKAFGTNTMFLEAVAALHGFLVALKLNGRRAYRLHVDNAGVVAVFKKGNTPCGYTWTVLKALQEVSVNTMSKVMVYKTKRVSH